MGGEPVSAAARQVVPTATMGATGATGRAGRGSPAAGAGARGWRGRCSGGLCHGPEAGRARFRR